MRFPKNQLPLQLNRGDVLGDLQMTSGIDLISEPGKIRNSPALLPLFDEGDDSDFNTPAIFTASTKFNASTQQARFFAATQGKIFVSAQNDPSTGWVEQTGSSTPTLTNRSDIVSFGSTTGSFVLVSGDSTGDIFAADPASDSASWSSAWIGLSGSAALSTTFYTPMRLAPNGSLYIVDEGRLVKRWQNDINGSVTTSGNGTLDLLYSGHRILTLEPSSTRMWLGTYATATGEGGVVEWDMSATSNTYNRIHRLPAPVICIAIWEDSPLAVTATGEVYGFNGTRFEKMTQFPTPKGFKPYTTASRFFTTPDQFSLMHPRGWMILDGLPHFLVNGQPTDSTALAGAKNLTMPSGIWALDPDMGLHCRFPLHSVKAVGGLLSTGDPDARFLAGVQTYTDSSGSDFASLLTEDTARSSATISRFSPTPFLGSSQQLWEKACVFHKKLTSGDEINLKYRQNRTDAQFADVTWVSTTQFTSTSDVFSEGNEVYVLIGNGAGYSAHVSAVTFSSPTYTVTLDRAITGVSNGNLGSVRVENWRKLATITAQNVDYHEFSFKDATASRKMEVLAELRAAADSTIEVDQINIDSNNV